MLWKPHSGKREKSWDQCLDMSPNPTESGIDFDTSTLKVKSLALGESYGKQLFGGILNTFLKKILFIFVFREMRREGDRGGRETSVCGCLSRDPYRGPGQQPRHVP